MTTEIKNCTTCGHSKGSGSFLYCNRFQKYPSNFLPYNQPSLCNTKELIEYVPKKKWWKLFA